MKQHILEKLKENTEVAEEITMTKQAVVNTFKQMIEDLDEIGIHTDRYDDLDRTRNTIQLAP